MSLITTYIYQPFFNLLVGYFYLLERIPNTRPDMGIAVILLTITIRLLMLPLTISGTRTKKERHAIEQTIKEAKRLYRNQPAKLKQAIRKTFRGSRRIVFSEAVNFFIQMLIFFILYRIFTTGLEGADMHLLYDFMPAITIHHDALVFLGKYDLTKTNLTLNIIQSLTILAVEVVNLIDSPFPVSRNEFVRYIIILPVASFLIFMFLPAGKKLFVITTLWFSFFYITIRLLNRAFQGLMDRLTAKSIQTAAESETVENSPEPAVQPGPTSPRDENLPHLE